jgi:PAS domain S-box-containing protein
MLAVLADQAAAALDRLPWEAAPEGVRSHPADRGTATLREQSELLERAHDAILVRDLDSRVRFWNRGAAATYGFTAAEAVGQVTHQLLRTRFPVSLTETEEVLLREGFWEGELVHTTRSGEQVTVASRHVLHRDADGRASAILEINRDITAQKRAEASQAGETVRWRLLSEAAAGLLGTEDPEAVLQGIFAQVAAHTGVDAYIHYVAAEGGKGLILESLAGFPADHPQLQRLDWGQGVCGRAAVARAPLYVPEVQANREPHTELIRGLGIRAYACEPVMVGDRLLGTLSFASRSVEGFDPQAIELFATMTHYVAIAKERKRLLDSERSKTEQLEAAVREAHHRIKNNLQAVTDLLALELDASGPAEGGEALRESIERIQAISVVHDLLSRDELEFVDIGELAGRLVPMVLKAASRSLTPVDVQLSVGRRLLPSKKATALALVMNELISNAAKHAFRGRAAGRLSVVVEEQGEGLVLSVQDDGSGLPEGFDFQRHAHVGLQVSRALVEGSLGGRLGFRSENGLRAEVYFDSR